MKVKQIFDDILSALYRYEGSNKAVTIQRLNEFLPVSKDEVHRLLYENTHSVLGLRKLLWPWRRSIQWNPVDDLIVAGQLILEDNHSIENIELSGELFIAESK
jgi:hypothetical protein